MFEIKEKRFMFYVTLIHLIINIIPKKRIKINKEKVLVITFNNLGDIICDTPSIKNIKNSIEKPYIVCLVRKEAGKELLKYCPYIDEILVMPSSLDSWWEFFKFSYKISKYDFDKSIQLTRPFNKVKKSYVPYMANIEKRYGLIQESMFKYYKKGFTNFYIVSNKTDRITESLAIVKKAGYHIKERNTECWYIRPNNFKLDKKYIVINTGANFATKIWNWNNFVEVINEFNFSDFNIYLTGTRDEEKILKKIQNKCNKKVKMFYDISLNDLLYIIDNSSLVITNDTGPMHFAIALKTPVIAIFGPTPPQYAIGNVTNNDKITILRGQTNCNPYYCEFYKKMDNKKKEQYKNICFNNKNVCTDIIKPKEVTMEIKKMLNKH